MEIESVPKEKLVKRADRRLRGSVRLPGSRAVAYGLGLEGDSAKECAKVVKKLARLFVDKDCSLAEINPLVRLKDGRILALDAKINFDDNALYRHPELQELRDPMSEEDPAEVAGGAVRPELRQPRRQHRLHGERRRAGDGHDGHHQAPRRLPGQLPRRRRRRLRRARHRGVQDHHRGSEREGDPHQHLRRHRQVRPDCRGRAGSGQGGRPQRAAGRPPRGHQRRSRPPADRGLRSRGHHRDGHDRRRPRRRWRRQAQEKAQ